MISVTILTKNSSKRLKEVIQALADFPEVLIFDTGSTDDTKNIALSFSNVSWYEGKLEGFGPTHNLASNLAKNDWILSIDSDEIVTKELAQELLSTSLDENSVYLISRHNIFNDKWIRWCGWSPDLQIKLYNRKKTRFTDAKVHESVIATGFKKIIFKNPLLHYSYDSISDFLSKMQSYSTLFAEQNKGKKSSSVFKALFHGWWTFFKSYVLKRGILGGYEGFVISAYNSHTAFYKYLKLYEFNTRLCPEEKGKSESSL